MVCPYCKKRIPRKSAYCLHCGAPLSAPAGADAPPVRACILCGRPLPEGGVSDLCDACLRGETPDGVPPEPELLPDFDESPPGDAPKSRRKLPRWLLPVLLVILLAAGGLLFFLLRPGAEAPREQAGAQTDAERYAVSCAQEMVRAQAYDPASVHFYQQGLSVDEEAGVYTVSQRFDRNTASGETLTETYTAKLTLSDGLDGYSPLMLEVGGGVLYDNRE